MTLGEARALVRQYVNEPIASHWTDAQLNAVIQEANREIWHKLSTVAPSWLTGSAIFTWPASISKLALPAVITSGGGAIGILQKVLGFFVVQTIAQLGQGNVPYPMRGITKISDLYQLRDVDNGGYNGGTILGGSGSLRYNYTMLGEDMCIWPVPTQAILLLLFGVSTVATPVTDNHNLFVAGVITNPTRLLDHQELVPLLAAIKAKTMIGDPDNGLTDQYKSRLQSTIQVLTLDQQMQDPQQVRGI